MKQPEAHERFGAWIELRGWSLADAAEAIGCDPRFVIFLRRGERSPGRRLAHVIEQLTADLTGGPIRTLDWPDRRVRNASKIKGPVATRSSRVGRPRRVAGG